MAMNGNQLADEIAASIGYGKTSGRLKCLGNGIVNEVRHGVATYGMIPGPHSISGISGSNMAQLIVTCNGYSYTSGRLVLYCNAIADHVMGAGIVTYAGLPLPTMVGWRLGGVISGLNGSVLAALIVNYERLGSVSGKLLAECTAIVNHIMNNADVETGVIS
jgi:hypothetical protein